MTSEKKLTPRERLKRIQEQDKKRKQDRLKMAKSTSNVIKLKFNEKNLLGVALLKLKSEKKCVVGNSILTKRQSLILGLGQKLFLSKNKFFEHYHDFVKATDLTTKENILTDLKMFDHMHCFSHITKKCIAEVEIAKNLS